MGDNVLDLTSRLTKRKKGIDWSEVASLVKGVLTNGVKDTTLHPLVAGLPEHMLLTDMPDVAWATLDVGANLEDAKDEEDTKYSLSFGSSFRRVFVPEFGIQQHVEFMHIDADEVETVDRSNVDPLKPATRDDALQILISYSNSFPQTPSVLWRFPLAFIDSLYQKPKVELLWYEIHDGQLGMVFAYPYTDSEGDQSVLVKVWFDFLPMILDASADVLLNQITQTD